MLISRVDRIKNKSLEKKARENRPIRKRREELLERNFVFEGIFGDNRQLVEIFEILEKASRTDLPVLIGGESGTGKELGENGALKQ